MERLTYRGHNGKGYVCNDDYYNHVSLQLARVAERLTAYEDTGLEPEEIPLVAEMQRQLEAYLDIGTVEYLTELVKAEREGRLVVLPCKVGDTLFVADKYKGKIYERTVERFTAGKRGYIEIWFGTTISVNAKRLGKTVFFTRAEAEAALGGGGEHG